MTDAELTRDGWQSVIEHMPDTDVTVYGACVNGPRYKYLGKVEFTGQWWKLAHTGEYVAVTHWKPLKGSETLQ